jgi:hypothetical protein
MKYFVLIVAVLALLSAIVPAFANVGHEEVCQLAAVPPAGVPVTRTTNGDYDLVTERSSRVPALECRIAALEARKCQTVRQRHFRAANKLSLQIKALKMDLEAERKTRAEVDEALRKRIDGEAQSRRTSDQEMVTFVTALVALVILAFGGYMILNR